MMKTMRTLSVAVALAAVLVACDSAPTKPTAPQPPASASSVALLAELLDSRSINHIDSYFDVDAANQLLQTTDPDSRAALFRYAVGDSAAALLTAAGLNPRGDRHPVAVITFTVRSDDPTKQALLNRMWAPYWQRLPASTLDDEASPFPGRAMARAQLVGRAAGGHALSPNVGGRP